MARENQVVLIGIAASIAVSTWATATAFAQCEPWEPLDLGTNQSATSLGVFDDGSGSSLYVGGNFSTAGAISANHIARWNGVAWSAVNSGINGKVNALVVFDNTLGPSLYAGSRVNDSHVTILCTCCFTASGS